MEIVQTRKLLFIKIWQ